MAVIQSLDRSFSGRGGSGSVACVEGIVSMPSTDTAAHSVDKEDVQVRQSLHLCAHSLMWSVCTLICALAEAPQSMVGLQS